MKKFTRNIEDFICLHCGRVVTGNGYTNHCPECLWSQHVDINPGDRASLCGGAMRPTGIETTGGINTIIHVCEKCGQTARIRANESDNMDAIIELSRNDGFVFGKK